MSLEVFTGWIKDLIGTNPPGGDPKSQGDDHIRGIKQTLLAQFSGLTLGKAVTVNEDDLNSVPETRDRAESCLPKDGSEPMTGRLEGEVGPLDVVTGASRDLIEYGATDTNSTRLLAKLFRSANGNSHLTSVLRLLRVVDATEQGFIDFTSGDPLRFGTANVVSAYMASDGSLFITYPIADAEAGKRLVSAEWVRRRAAKLKSGSNPGVVNLSGVLAGVAQTVTISNAGGYVKADGVVNVTMGGTTGSVSLSLQIRSAGPPSDVELAGRTASITLGGGNSMSIPVQVALDNVAAGANIYAVIYGTSSQPASIPVGSGFVTLEVE